MLGELAMLGFVKPPHPDQQVSMLEAAIDV